MPKAFTLDGAPDGLYRPDRNFVRRWAEKRGVDTDRPRERPASGKHGDPKKSNS